jgi:hypothetical protein
MNRFCIILSIFESSKILSTFLKLGLKSNFFSYIKRVGIPHGFYKGLLQIRTKIIGLRDLHISFLNQYTSGLQRRKCIRYYCNIYLFST